MWLPSSWDSNISLSKSLSQSRALSTCRFFAAGKLSFRIVRFQNTSNVWPCVLVLEPRWMLGCKPPECRIWICFKYDNRTMNTNEIPMVSVSQSLQTLMMNHSTTGNWSSFLLGTGQICKGYVKLPGLYNIPLKTNGLFTYFPRFQLWWNFPF